MFFLTMVLLLTNICCLPTDVRAIAAEDETTGKVAFKKQIEIYTKSERKYYEKQIKCEAVHNDRHDIAACCGIYRI